MILEGPCLTRRGTSPLTVARGPLARLLLAWTALLCVAGVQGRWDGAVQPAGLGSVRRRGSPGFLQGCVVPRMLRGPWAWAGPSCWVGERGPGDVQPGRGSPASPALLKAQRVRLPLSRLLLSWLEDAAWWEPVCCA